VRRQAIGIPTTTLNQSLAGPTGRQIPPGGLVGKKLARDAGPLHSHAEVFFLGLKFHGKRFFRLFKPQK
jgi:hypothetical protein